MAARQGIFSKDTFQFFRDLKKNNHKDWMDAHRDRYQAAVVQPLKKLLEEMAPTVLDLDHRFETTGRRGANLSRINRDIRFAKDKTLYKTNMYLKFSAPLGGEMESGELYVGIAADSVTVGFRVYATPKRKQSPIALIAEPRLAKNPKWLAQQKAKLGRKYDSYWYSTVKGEWTKNSGWPTNETWPKLQGWIVRKKLSPAAALRASFPNDIAKIFRDVFPVLKTISLFD
ncbi:MAG TPA: DUF2461 family protein [Candidatus Acidoferrum sp.]|nr:DUF2461 family protein [Candidatus Acidoferrum sp.]